MGVKTRKLGELYIISSDRVAGDLPTKSAPKRQTTEVYQVWTGDRWSKDSADAMAFQTMDEADEYVRANSNRVMEVG